MRLNNPKRTRSYAEDCAAMRQILTLIGDKWSVLVIVSLGQGTQRFSDLKRGIDGISQRMLTLTLRGLEREGLLKRKVYPTVPARVEYTLSRLGRSLLKPVSALAIWADEHRPEMEASRAAYAARSAKRSP